MDTAIISAVLPMLIKGFWVTMEIAVVGILLGFLLGAVSGYALQGKCRVARTAAGVYIWLIRGTPIVVQALYIYFVVPAILSLIEGEQVTMDSVLAGIIVITVNAGAFISAIVKGALESVEIGQIEAGRALGFSNARIIVKHIIPNVINPIIVISAANFATAILLEAGLSFLGIGVQPPMPSWGSMIKENYAYIILDNAYLALLPGLAIMLLVLAFMLMGNALRDALNVR